MARKQQSNNKNNKTGLIVLAILFLPITFIVLGFKFLIPILNSHVSVTDDPKTEKLYTVQWVLTGIFLLGALGACARGVLGVLGGVFWLAAAFVVSPLVEKVPVMTDKKSLKIVLQFVVAFVFLSLGAVIMPQRDSVEAPASNTLDYSLTQTEPSTIEADTTEETTEPTTEKPTESPTTEPPTTESPTESPTTEPPTDPPTEPPTDPPTDPPTEPPTNPPPVPEPQPAIVHFIINTDTNCVHTKDTCSAAQKILAENYATMDIYESDIPNYAYQYWACGICSKGYSDLLPKY